MGLELSAGARWCRAQSAVVEHFYHAPWKTLEALERGGWRELCCSEGKARTDTQRAA